MDAGLIKPSEDDAAMPASPLAPWTGRLSPVWLSPAAGRGEAWPHTLEVMEGRVQRLEPLPAAPATAGRGVLARMHWLPTWTDLALCPDGRDLLDPLGLALLRAQGLADARFVASSAMGRARAVAQGEADGLSQAVPPLTDENGAPCLATDEGPRAQPPHRALPPGWWRDWPSLRPALRWAADAGVTVWVPLACPASQPHAHDGVDAGPWALRQGLRGVSRDEELMMVSMALLLGRQAGVRLHLDQLSTAESVQMLSQARGQGQAVSASVSIHHLLFTHVDVGTALTAGRMSPPLRLASDRSALGDAVASGVIQAVVSGHRWPDAAHGAAHGVPGAAMLVPGLVKWAAGRGLPLAQAWRAISQGPREVLDPSAVANAAGLAVGQRLDGVLLEEGAWTTVWPADSAQAARWGLLAHTEWPGRVWGSVHQGRWWPLEAAKPATMSDLPTS